MDWLAFFDKEVHVRTTLEHFLAQIACEVRRSYVKKPSRVKLEHFLLKFASTEKPRTPGNLTAKQKMELSKIHWLGGLGLQEDLQRELEK